MTGTRPSKPLKKRLTAVMKARDWHTLKEVAQHTGMDRRRLYALCNPVDTTLPSLEELVQFAVLFEIPTHELLYEFLPDAPGAPDHVSAGPGN